MRRISVGSSLDDYGASCRSAWRLTHAAVGAWGLARESLERLGEVVDIGLELKRATNRAGVDCEKIIDPVVSFDEAPGAYEEYVDRNPQKSVKLGIAFV